MLRASRFLTLIRLTIQPCADANAPLPAEALPHICVLLRVLAEQCEGMETRLAGEPVLAAGGNVVSLADWAAEKGLIPPPTPGGAA